ncbi:MAG: hypothetical protein ACOVOC_16680, partial [Rhabdaerophilum sp.]
EVEHEIAQLEVVAQEIAEDHEVGVLDSHPHQRVLELWTEAVGAEGLETTVVEGAESITSAFASAAE